MDESHLANLRQRYVAYFGEEPSPAGAIANLESSIDVSLPGDLKAIADFYSGGMLGGVSHHVFSSGVAATNVADETLRLRSTVELPHRFIVLAEPAESLIVLDVESGVVTWCDDFDASRLDGSNRMVGEPSTWPSYAAFFEYLLGKEGEERQEQG